MSQYKRLVLQRRDGFRNVVRIHYFRPDDHVLIDQFLERLTADQVCDIGRATSVEHTEDLFVHDKNLIVRISKRAGLGGRVISQRAMPTIGRQGRWSDLGR